MENAVLGVRSIELEVCDLQSAAAFFSRVWKLEELARASGAIYFREQFSVCFKNDVEDIARVVERANIQLQ